MKWKTIFFDLDGTLYDNQSGLWDAIKERINLYLHEVIGIPWSAIPDIRENYYRKYGTTLRGLQLHYNVDPMQYLSFTHDINLDDYLKPNPELRSMLNSLPLDKWIFTNADINHAKRVLKTLGIDDCFKGIIDVFTTNFAPKPTEEAFNAALSTADVQEVSECIFVDDSARNVIAAQELGFYSILVSNGNESISIIPNRIDTILEMQTKFPYFWRK